MDLWVWWLGATLTAGLVGLALVVAARRIGHGLDAGIDPSDEAELDEIFAQVRSREAAAPLLALEQHLKRMIARQVPLRFVRTAATTGVARLGFADGTVLMARGNRPSSFPVLARQLELGGVHPGKVVNRIEWLDLELTTRGGVVSVRVLGRDQAD